LPIPGAVVMMKLTEDGVERFLLRISNALNDSAINGFEMEFLSDMIERFLEQRDKVNLSQKQWTMLETVLQKTEPMDRY
jgi:hypothetical protein